MTEAAPKTLAAVVSFLSRQKLEFKESDEQHCAKLEVRSGARRATVSVYSTGRIVVGGPETPLRKLLQDMKDGIEAGGFRPGQALPFEIDQFPDTIRERVPECDPVIIRFVDEAIRDEGNRNKFFLRINNRMIRSCRSRPSDPTLATDLDVLIGKMFQFCRITRNEVGHPQIVPDLDREVLLANLGQVVTYVERIYALMRRFRQNGVEV